MKVLLAIVMMTLVLAGCGEVRPMVGAPWKQKDLMDGPTDSPEKFRQGWRDGCETSIAANANHLQKFFYRFKQNSDLAQDAEYYAGWKTARDYCQKYVFNYLATELVSGDTGEGLSLYGSQPFFKGSGAGGGE